VDELLARDGDERVRALLAGRIARLLPELKEADQAGAAEHARATLAVLIEDEAVRVRTALAEALKEMPEAPHDLILRLARDPVLPISDAVVQLSPVLTDADLIGLLAAPPHPSTAVSIAGRSGLSVRVADAIAAHANAPAVKAMLANHSARISEATLDALVGGAPEHQEWHNPLVRRPMLSGNAARMLSTFVTTQLLEVLAQRADLDPVVMQTIRTRLQARLKAGTQEEHQDRALITEVLRLKKASELGESVLLAAARAGEVRRVAAILAVACEVRLSTIDRVVGLRSAKALVSLVWRAGFTMQSGTAVQTVLGHVGPGHLLTPARNDGFPLSEDEMRWQLELLNEAAQRPAAQDFRKPSAFASEPAYHA